MPTLDPVRREVMLRHVWPDKLVHAATLLLVVGAAGALQGSLALVTPLSLSNAAPAVVRAFPPEATLVLSLAAAGLAVPALLRHDLRLGAMSVVAAFFSFGLLGAASLVALAAGVLLARAAAEREHANPQTLRLEAHEWPDKTLAAATVLTVLAAVALAWGTAALAGLVAFTLVAGPVDGALAVAAGLLAAFAAREVYHQRGRAWGLAAGVAGVATLAFYVVGPALGAAALVLLAQAKREREFE